ncbi:DUF1176 domain-containing protein [Psychrobacter sp. SWN149]|uniref:DUF1176 domain-containing protein n=1 Tax=Psychrobacter sp. SWN149 TaxID=2792057 RepID=UPI0018CF0ACF|nr:DUF1176 domain-containing protein [Psychrobacter sp. SWN149]MBH0007626.1 DUF1176 domain-containing protein [Psychrobacter sp. SWN149]
MKTVMALMTIGLFSLPAVASDAYGDPFEGWGFVKDDWQVVCDNTLTCRAAGYAGEEQWDTPATILMTAIPKKALPTGLVQLLPEASEKSQNNVTLWLNGKNYGRLQPSSDGGLYDLTAKQTNSLINSARLNTKIEIKASSDSWTVSDKGMGAVLLKLDEVQGRVGTPIALVSKNSMHKQTPKSAKPKPIIKKAFSYSEKDNKTLSAAKQAYFQANINRWINIDDEQFVGSENTTGNCELINPKSETSINFAKYAGNSSGWDFIPIDATHTLAVHSCWMGAYNAASGYWLIDNAKPRNPQLITTAGNDYFEGEISANHKDRGIGDCWNSKTWVWNGTTFAKMADASTGMCKGFAGGAWDLPTYVSEVIEGNRTSDK